MFVPAPCQPPAGPNCRIIQPRRHPAQPPDIHDHQRLHIAERGGIQRPPQQRSPEFLFRHKPALRTSCVCIACVCTPCGGVSRNCTAWNAEKRSPIPGAPIAGIGRPERTQAGRDIRLHVRRQRRQGGHERRHGIGAQGSRISRIKLVGLGSTGGVDADNLGVGICHVQAGNQHKRRRRRAEGELLPASAQDRQHKPGEDHSQPAHKRHRIQPQLGQAAGVLIQLHPQHRRCEDHNSSATCIAACAENKRRARAFRRSCSVCRLSSRGSTSAATQTSWKKPERAYCV